MKLQRIIILSHYCQLTPCRGKQLNLTVVGLYARILVLADYMLVVAPDGTFRCVALVEYVFSLLDGY